MRPVHAAADHAESAEAPVQESAQGVLLRAVLSRVLWWGTVAAACVLGVGVVLMIVHRSATSGATTDATTGSVAGGASVGVRVGYAGVVMLVALPAVRVLASLLVFARSREWLFVALSAAVLGSLAAGLLVG